MRPDKIADAAAYIARHYGREAILREKPFDVQKMYDAFSAEEKKRWTDDEWIQGWASALYAAVNVNNRHEFVRRSRYLAEHTQCPQCTADAGIPSFVDPVDVDWGAEELRDANVALCGICGWQGIIHDLVAKKKEDA